MQSDSITTRDIAEDRLLDIAKGVVRVIREHTADVSTARAFCQPPVLRLAVGLLGTFKIGWKAIHRFPNFLKLLQNLLEELDNVLIVVRHKRAVPEGPRRDP
jgi:hypothetical protein